jgi:hypothetical protein
MSMMPCDRCSGLGPVTFAYSLLHSHHYLDLTPGPSYKNMAVFKVTNEGPAPLWFSTGGYTSCVRLEGVDVVHETPLMPRCTKEYGLMLQVIPAGENAIGELAEDIFLTLTINLEVRLAAPNGPNNCVHHTPIYLGVLIPAGEPWPFKLLKHFE